MSTPSRVVVLVNGERVVDMTGVTVEVMRQDDDETLKVLVDDLPADEKQRANARHMTRLGQSLNLE